MYRWLLCVALAMFHDQALAQQASYSDPAQAYNRLLIEKKGGGFTRIGKYKVSGSPYFFGEAHPTQIFEKGRQPQTAEASYNLYSQQMEFYFPADPAKLLVKEPQDLDSFFISLPSQPDTARFINGIHLAQTDREFYQILTTGKRFELYKKYTVTLELAEGNYADADLRQFELQAVYYYRDKKNRSFKKIRPTASVLRKAFGESASIPDNVDLAQDPETALKRLINSLNDRD